MAHVATTIAHLDRPLPHDPPRHAAGPFPSDSQPRFPAPIRAASLLRRHAGWRSARNAGALPTSSQAFVYGNSRWRDPVHRIASPAPPARHLQDLLEDHFLRFDAQISADGVVMERPRASVRQHVEARQVPTGVAPVPDRIVTWHATTLAMPGISYSRLRPWPLPETPSRARRARPGRCLRRWSGRQSPPLRPGRGPCR